jgi:hypothetical protein
MMHAETMQAQTLHASADARMAAAPIRRQKFGGLIRRSSRSRGLPLDLMDRRAAFHAHALDFVFDQQLLALQFGNAEIVCGRVIYRFVQFVFENLVLPFKLRKMRLNRHRLVSSMNECQTS